MKKRLLKYLFFLAILLSRLTSVAGKAPLWIGAPGEKLSVVGHSDYPAPGDPPCNAPIPQLIGPSSSVCAGADVVLSATGCTGTVIWSNGMTGASITLHPQQTTRYTAVCRLGAGCVSCFADPLTVTVNKPEVPLLTASSTLVCVGDSVLISARISRGTIRWNDGVTGDKRFVKLRETSQFLASNELEGCLSGNSPPLTIAVETPRKPVLATRKSLLCDGESVVLAAEGSTGLIRWSDGITGAQRTINPRQTVQYTAYAEIGSCRSDPSEPLTLQVSPKRRTAPEIIEKTNVCPYLTADLSSVVKRIPEGGQIEFRTGPSPETPLVRSPGAVQEGLYYVFERSAEGCYNEPIPVRVIIRACEKGIPVCLSNPPRVAARPDTLLLAGQPVALRAELNGSAMHVRWATIGSGRLEETEELSTRYHPSEADRQQGSVAFTVTVPDPDGDGPCAGAAAHLLVSLSRAAALPGMQTDSIPTDSIPIREEVFIPEGFSPNNDGINDRFEIRNIPSGLTVSLEIFNRWGHAVYRSSDYRNDWDGTANQGVLPSGKGAPLPDGTYFYIVRLSDGREFVRFLTLSR